jgi:hypothetical protein
MMDRRSTLRRSSCLGIGCRVLNCWSEMLRVRGSNESERCEDLEKGVALEVEKNSVLGMG